MLEWIRNNVWQMRTIIRHTDEKNLFLEIIAEVLLLWFDKDKTGDGGKVYEID